MPISLSKIALNTSSIKIDVKDDDGEILGDVNVTYYPGRVTEKTFQQIMALSSLSSLTSDKVTEVPAIFEGLNEILIRLVKSWDLLEEDNITPVALEASRLADISLMFRMQVAMEIVSDMRPNTDAP